MNPFLAMLLSLRIGFLPSPASSAALSIREEALQVATNVAARDALEHRERVIAGAPKAAPGAAVAAGAGAWSEPPRIRVLQREDWRNMIADKLNGNQTIANMATWLAAAPLRLNVTPQKFFVAISLRTP